MDLKVCQEYIDELNPKRRRKRRRLRMPNPHPVFWVGVTGGAVWTFLGIALLTWLE